MTKEFKQYKIQLDAAQNEKEQIALIHKFLSDLGGNNHETSFRLIDLGIVLAGSNGEEKFKLLNRKSPIITANGLTEENIKYCEYYDEMLLLHPECYKYKIDLSKLRMMALFDLGLKQEAIDFGEETLKVFAEVEDEEIETKLIEIYRVTGGLSTAIGDYPKCFKYLKKAIEISKKYSILPSLVRLYGTLGDIYRSNFEAQKAIGYLTEGLKLEEELNSPIHRVGLLRNLGLSYYQLKDYKQAEEYYLKALASCADAKDERSLFNVFNALAELHLTNGEFKKFEDIKKRINLLDIFKNDENLQAEVLLVFSQGYLAKKDYAEALEYANLCEEIRVRLNAFINLNNLYEVKIDIYKATEEYESAALYYSKLIELREKMMNQKSKNAFQEFESKFQNERKEKEIQTLKLNSINYQLQSLRSQMNPQFIFNTIEKITDDLIPSNIHNSKNLLASFAKIMRAKMLFAEEEYISLEDEIEFLNNYLKLEQVQLPQGLDFSITYKDDLDVDFIEIPTMLFQEHIAHIINESLKNAPYQSSLKINFKENDDEALICTIEDNGIQRSALTKRKVKLPSTEDTQAITINEDKENINVVHESIQDSNGAACGSKLTIIINS